MTNHVDLTGIRSIHRQMRIDTRRFATAVERATRVDRVRNLPALARWAVGFGHELHVHHTIEDSVHFPHLAE